MGHIKGSFGVDRVCPICNTLYVEKPEDWNCDDCVMSKTKLVCGLCNNRTDFDLCFTPITLKDKKTPLVLKLFTYKCKRCGHTVRLVKVEMVG
jgi:hypothetical protein